MGLGFGLWFGFGFGLGLGLGLGSANPNPNPSPSPIQEPGARAARRGAAQLPMARGAPQPLCRLALLPQPHHGGPPARRRLDR